MTNAQLSISQSYLSRLESGRYDMPSRLIRSAVKRFMDNYQEDQPGAATHD